MQHIVGYYRVTSVNAENQTLSYAGDIFLVAPFVAFLFLIFRIIAASSNTPESFSTAEAPSVRYNMPELFVAGQLGGNYGLTLGLKGDAIDFQNNTITSSTPLLPATLTASISRVQILGISRENYRFQKRTHGKIPKAQKKEKACKRQKPLAD